eukprot:gene16938-22979_t
MSYLEDSRSGLTPASMHWKATAFGVFFLAVFCAVAVHLYRYDPPVAGALADPQLRGISGWLLLAALALLLTPIRGFGGLVESWPLLNELNWTALTREGGARFSALWEPVLIFSLAVNLMSVVMGALIPRPETELLVEMVLAASADRASAAATVLDLGTGSGAIALAMAKG